MIYFAQLPGGAIKIGCMEDVETRLSQLGSHYGTELALLVTMPGDRSVEAEIHERFSHLRLGRTEQFQPGADLIQFIGKPLLVNPYPEAVEATPSIDKPTVTLRGGPDWKEWLEGFADHCRLDVSKLIDKALIQYAKTEGYNREAPRR
jgi:hypothetical protein